MGELRNIFAWVVVDGAPILCKRCSVDQTKTHSGDKFSADIPFKALPPGLGVAYWAETMTADVSVIAGARTIGAALMFVGEIDTVHLDFAQRMLRISGRDKSKKAMETRTVESHQNKTSSEVVERIAAKHGYEPQVEATVGRAGRIHDLDWVKLSDRISDWTLLQHLADREGKVCYLSKNRLMFKQLDGEAEGDFQVVAIEPTPAMHAEGNFVHLAFDRNLEAAKPHEVNVRSHHTKTGESVTSTAKAGGPVARSAQSSGASGGIVGGGRTP